MDSDIRFTQNGLLVIGSIVTALAGAIGLLFKTLMKAKDDQNAQIIEAMKVQSEQLLKDKEILYADLKRERDSFRSMTVSAVANLEIVANLIRRERGLAPLEKVAPVVPESNSPPTAQQIIAAEIATLRARIVAACLAVDFPPQVLETASGEISSIIDHWNDNIQPEEIIV